MVKTPVSPKQTNWKGYKVKMANAETVDVKSNQYKFDFRACHWAWRKTHTYEFIFHVFCFCLLARIKIMEVKLWLNCSPCTRKGYLKHPRNKNKRTTMCNVSPGSLVSLIFPKLGHWVIIKF